MFAGPQNSFAGFELNYTAHRGSVFPLISMKSSIAKQLLPPANLLPVQMQKPKQHRKATVGGMGGTREQGGVTEGTAEEKTRNWKR